MEKDSLIHPVGLVVMGGSAGSFDVIMKMLPHLHVDLAFPVIVVLHRKNSFDSSLTELFTDRSVLKVKEAEDKDELKAGTIYLAPADYHLLVEKDYTLTLDYSERVHYSRPSIDVTFETAAEAFGKATAGIVLSGANADGTEGLQMIHQAGGITAVQNPAMAEVSYMPAQAIARTAIDYILENNEIGSFINKLSERSVYSE